MPRFLFPVLLAVVALACAGTASASRSGDGLTALTTALIGGNCGATSKAFAPWGDRRDYYPTANGGFESGSAGWTLGGASVVPGNEPFFLHGSADRSSLLIPSGATATSPLLCFGLLNPGVRLVAASPTGKATLRLRVIARGLLGGLSTLDGGTVTVGSTWAPTPVFATTVSQLNMPVGTKSIQLQFSATGPVQIDDIYIDPFLSR